MPNLDTIRKSQERRAAREAKVKATEQESKDQEYKLAKLSEQLQAQRGGKPKSHIEGEEPVSDDDDVEGASIVGDRRRPDSRADRDARARSRGEQKIMRQIAAEKQADLDAQATTAPDDGENVDLAFYRQRGVEPPLHVLNKLAVRADRQMRDEAREVGQAVGRAAMDVLSERRATQGRESRMNQVAGQMTNIAKQNALNAAKKD
jgi:hypothetical protein